MSRDTAFPARSSMNSLIGLDKSGYQVNSFLFLNENICCGYSLEVPHFLDKNICCGTHNKKKNIDTFWLKNMPYQEL